MIYIFSALKPEAQAFVDKYKLSKIRIDNYTLYINENIVLIITHLGVHNCSKACKFIVQNYKIGDDDIFLNVGICGASKNYKIGDLIEIGTINFDKKSFTFKDTDKTITCIDYEEKNNNYDLVDMESYGFYESLQIYKDIFIFKVVSDHFEPQTITKEKTKMLIFNKLDEILEKVNI